VFVVRGQICTGQKYFSKSPQILIKNERARKPIFLQEKSAKQAPVFLRKTKILASNYLKETNNLMAFDLAFETKRHNFDFIFDS
jgi:hypothetical protein